MNSTFSTFTTTNDQLHGTVTQSGVSNSNNTKVPRLDFRALMDTAASAYNSNAGNNNITSPFNSARLPGGAVTHKMDTMSVASTCRGQRDAQMALGPKVALLAALSTEQRARHRVPDTGYALRSPHKVVNGAMDDGEFSTMKTQNVYQPELVDGTTSVVLPTPRQKILARAQGTVANQGNGDFIFDGDNTTRFAKVSPSSFGVPPNSFRIRNVNHKHGSPYGTDRLNTAERRDIFTTTTSRTHSPDKTFDIFRKVGYRPGEARNDSNPSPRKVVANTGHSLNRVEVKASNEFVEPISSTVRMTYQGKRDM